MQQINSNNNLSSPSNEIDLRLISHILFQGKWVILSVTTFFSIVGVIYSLSLPNIYESRALLAPTKSSGISRSLQSYGNLAGLAGINLPSGGVESNTAKAIKKIGSFSFFENNIQKNIFLPNLMAIKAWNAQTNELTYDESLYIKKSNTWVRDYSYPMKKIPSAQESFNVFAGKHLNLNEDKATGFITLSIKHQSPFVAKKWTELVVNEINTFYRQKDKLESKKAASYLNQQILKTSLSEIKLVMAQLIQEETKKLTLIEANEYYVFDYIDPPAVMEKKVQPSRALICIVFAILGGLLSIFLVFLKFYITNEELHKSIKPNSLQT